MAPQSNNPPTGGNGQLSSTPSAAGGPGVTNVLEKPAKQSYKSEVQVTYDEIVTRHEISDEKLSRLEKGDQSTFFQFALFFWAVFLGSAVQGWERVGAVERRTSGGLSHLDIFTIALPVISVVLAIIFTFLWDREKNEIKALVDQIRRRKWKPGK